MKSRIEISENVIKILSVNDGTTNSSTMFKNVKASGYSGLIEKDNSFSARQDATASMDQIGSLVFVYHMTGKFSGKEWKGEYKYSFSSSDGTICSHSTTFNGSLLTPSTTPTAMPPTATPTATTNTTPPATPLNSGSFLINDGAKKTNSWQVMFVKIPDSIHLHFCGLRC